jgi:hypothetical protein
MLRRILWLVFIFCLQGHSQYIYEANQPLYHLQTNANAFQGELAYEIVDDGISPVIDFSFDFNFYGNTFDFARIATNGCLHFGLTSTAYADYCGDFTPDPLPRYKNTLYPFWTDLIRDNNSRIKSYGDSEKMIFGWYDMREYNRSGSDNSFEIILWSNHTFEYRYGALDIINHDVLIGEQGPDSNKIYTYLFHDECNTGTTNSSSCVNTNWNNTSFNTTLENGGSLYSDGSDHSIDCSNPLNDSSCTGYADALLTQQCNLSQLYSTSCPDYDEAYDELQCEEDPQYRPFCSGYRQEDSVAFFQEDDMNFGGQRNDGQHQDMFGHDDMFSNEDFLLGDPFVDVNIIRDAEIFEEPLLDEPIFFDFNDDGFAPMSITSRHEDLHSPHGGPDGPIPYNLQPVSQLAPLPEYDVPQALLPLGDDILISELVIIETVLIDDFQEPTTFVEFDSIEELDEWFENERGRHEEPHEEVAQMDARPDREQREEVIIEQEVEEVLEDIREEQEEVAELEEEVSEEEEILELHEEELVADNKDRKAMKMNIVADSIKAAANSVNYGTQSSNSGGYGVGGNSSSSTTHSGSSSSFAGSSNSTSSSPSISDQIASASVQTNNILSMSQNSGDMSGIGSQIGGSITTSLIPLPTADGGQMVMAEVQINNLQGDISSATSGVVSASEADEIANQIIENNIKSQQEEIQQQQEETGEYADQTTLVAYLGFVPGFDSYKTLELPKQDTWYEAKEIYSDIVMNDNINAFYGLAGSNINTMNILIQEQPNLQEE